MGEVKGGGGALSVSLCAAVSQIHQRPGREAQIFLNDDHLNLEMVEAAAQLSRRVLPAGL